MSINLPQGVARIFPLLVDSRARNPHAAAIPFDIYILYNSFECLKGQTDTFTYLHLLLFCCKRKKL